MINIGGIKAMTEYSNLITTENGKALIIKATVGDTNIKFTKVCTSSVIYEQEQLESLTFLDNIEQTSSVSNISYINEDTIKVESAFANKGLLNGYYMRTLGLFADDPDKGEILYAVCIASDDNCYMPPDNGVASTGVYITMYQTVGNADSVSLEVNSDVYATIGDIQDIVEKLNSKLDTTGDIYDTTITFTDNDDVEVLEEVNLNTGDVIKKEYKPVDNAWYELIPMTEPGATVKDKMHQILTKISTLFHNVRYLYSLLGTTDISDIGGGTVTGAISKLYNRINLEESGSVNSVTVTNGTVITHTNILQPGTYFLSYHTQATVTFDARHDVYVRLMDKNQTNMLKELKGCSTTFPNSQSYPCVNGSSIFSTDVPSVIEFFTYTTTEVYQIHYMTYEIWKLKEV